MLPKVVETRTAKFWVEDGILHAVATAGAHQTVSDARESTAGHIAALEGRPPLPLLCDISNLSSMTRDCRVHYGSVEHGQTYAACALLIGSPVSRVIANFFLGLNKPVNPTRVFTSRDKALEWLEAFRAHESVSA